MRDILFKAKRIDNGEWVEGWIVPTMHNTYHDGYRIIDVRGINYDELDGWEPTFISWEVDKNTISQYTGLNDKNGNRICENDVVVRVDRRNGLYVFREQPKMNCKVVWTDRHGFDTVPSCGYFGIKNALECEVIGNVFDNPELLEGGAV